MTGSLTAGTALNTLTGYYNRVRECKGQIRIENQSMQGANPYPQFLKQGKRMGILVKNMKMPTRCWDCPFYETGHEESYCRLTGKDVARWTPTPRPDNCPLIEVESPKHGHWINNNGLYQCSLCKEYTVMGWASCIPIEYMNKTMKYCNNCGARMDEVENG